MLHTQLLQVLCRVVRPQPKRGVLADTCPSNRAVQRGLLVGALQLRLLVAIDLALATAILQEQGASFVGAVVGTDVAVVRLELIVTAP